MSTFTGAYYGGGQGPIHLDNVDCVGNEDSILDCPYDSGTDDCTHAQDVGVVCYNQSMFLIIRNTSLNKKNMLYSKVRK